MYIAPNDVGLLVAITEAVAATPDVDTKADGPEVDALEAEDEGWTLRDHSCPLIEDKLFERMKYHMTLPLTMKCTTH